jgi:ABC-2 type transport system permease protein
LQPVITESLGNKIISGDFIIDLIKPINLIFTLWSSSLGMVSATLINQCSLLIAIFMPILIKLDVTLLSLVVFIIVSILGLILSSILYVLIGYLAFLVIEIWPYKRLLDDTIRFLSGSIIPIAFFPDILKKIIMLFPFHFMYSFPIKILLENITPNEIITNLAKMILWICILLLFLWKIYKNSVRHCIVQGG